MSAYELLVGIDWSTRSHQVCVMSASGAVLKEIAVDHDAGAVHGFIETLLQLSAGDSAKIAIAIEIPRGGLVESLLERGLHVYTLNPKQVDRFRDRHSVSGAKDDRRDALVLADALRTDLHKFRQVGLDHPLIIQIREFTRADEDLREELNRLTNRLREQLHRVFPGLLKLAPAANEPWFWELTSRVMKSSTGRIAKRHAEQLLRQYRIRRISGDDIIDILRQDQLRIAPGAAEAARAHIALLLPRLMMAHEQRGRCSKQLAMLVEAYAAEDEDERAAGPSDVEILRSAPGVGVGVTATLLAEAASLLLDRNYPALRALAGLAPVTKRSGKSHVVQMRYGCNTRLRNAFYHWARTSVQRDTASRRYYSDLRSRGHSHGRALRSVSDRWLRIMMAMLENRTTFEADHTTRVPAAA